MAGKNGKRREKQTTSHELEGIQRRESRRDSAFQWFKSQRPLQAVRFPMQVIRHQRSDRDSGIQSFAQFLSLENFNAVMVVRHDKPIRLEIIRLSRLNLVQHSWRLSSPISAKCNNDVLHLNWINH